MRYVFLLLCALLALTGCQGEPPPAPQPALPEEKASPAPIEPAVYDLVIRGGRIVDGSGGPGYTGDVALVGAKIVAVGKLGPHTAQREIRADGLAVAPGFINPHSHTHDFINPFEDWDATASLMQGITTEIGGVDGRSPLPIGEELRRVLAKGTGVNFGLFVGQGSVRQSVMGNAWGAATPIQLEQMKEIVREAMADGAFGLSTGLEYLPGRHAGQAEVTALVAETGAHGGIYSTHIRSEGDDIEAAVSEALSIAKAAGVPLNLSHFKLVKHANWSKLDRVIRLIEQAQKQGQTVFADVYPYLAPDYAVNRPLSEWLGALPAEYLVITQSRDPALAGKTLSQAAADRKQPAADLARSLMAEDPSLTVVALLNSEEAMIRFYRSDWSVVSTDGESQPKLAHPKEALQLRLHRRSYGSYPLLLGHYVRERGILSLEAMVRKMSGAVADHLGIRDRGYLKPGYHADIVIFDPTTVTDRTSWLRPQEYPAGIRWVWVNGQAVVQEGERIPGRPGQIVRPGAAKK